MKICKRRTAYFNMRPEHRVANGLPAGPLPHIYGSRKRTLIGGQWSEWSHPKCSWCGALEANR